MLYCQPYGIVFILLSRVLWYKTLNRRMLRVFKQVLLGQQDIQDQQEDSQGFQANPLGLEDIPDMHEPSMFVTNM